MKKTYISPSTLCVEIRCNQMLAESIGIDSDITVTEVGNAGWVKEESNLTSKSIWDNEW